MDLHIWININTYHSKTVVELGAGFMDKLASVHPNVERKIGVELWQPYIDHAKYKDCIMINGDVRDFEKLIDPENMDTLMLIDILEHFTESEALELMSRFQICFKKILLMIPEGNHPQNKDVTGYEAHELQTHRSSWTKKKIKILGFQEVEVDPNFHSEAEKDTGCIFAIWEKGV